MMTLSNSKTLAVETSRSQPDGGAYHRADPSAEDMISCLRSRGFLHEETPFHPQRATQDVSYRLGYVLSQTYTCDSTHIAPTLSTRLSPIRF
jgi:hypothetical protein